VPSNLRATYGVGASAARPTVGGAAAAGRPRPARVPLAPQQPHQPPPPPGRPSKRAMQQMQQMQQMHAAPEMMAPSFMGAASRKRKWEIAAGLGLVPALGHSADPYLQQQRGRGRPQPPTQGFAGKGGGAIVGGAKGAAVKGAAVKGAAAKGGAKVGAKGGAAAGNGAGGKGAWVPRRAGEAPAPSSKVAPTAAWGGEDGAPPKRPRAGANGGKGGGKRGAAAPTPPTTAVHWISLPPSAQFVVNGLPDLGPAVVHSPDLQTLLAAGASILEDIGVSADSITLTHDAEWEQFPEVAEAVKVATQEERAICVAECSEASIWAVGTGGKWKQRELAARLALCVALAANMEDFSGLANSQPEFTALCESVGITTGVDDAMAKPEFPPRPPRAAPQAKAAEAQADRAAPASNGAKKHRDTPLYINLLEVEEEVPEALQAYLPEALVLCTDGGRRALYNKADAAIAHVLGEKDVEYHDDPNWDTFPAVGKAVEKATGAQECLCVAVSPLAGLWAVGVGNKGQNRQKAAKVALAAQIAIQMADVGEEVDCSEFPALAEFIEEARAAKDVF